MFEIELDPTTKQLGEICKMIEPENVRVTNYDNCFKISS